MEKRVLSFVVLMLVVANIGLGQKLNFKNYSVSDGLPQGQVHDLVQTSDGYMWLATYGGGLAKFDGQEFENYTTRDGLRDNSIEELFVDSGDHLWVASDNGGVARFRGDSLVYPFDNDSLASYSVVAITESRQNQLWFGTYKGGVFIREEDHFRRLTKADGLSSNSIWDIQTMSNGSVWLATQKGVSIYRKGDQIQTFYKEDGLSGDKVYKIMERSNGDKWIATNKGISIWNGQDFKTITNINGNELNSVYGLLEASDGTIWIGTESQGVYLYDGHDYTHITKKNGLSSNYIYRLFKDQHGNIWIATDEDGVCLFKENGFIIYDKETGLQHNKILSVYRQGDTFWLGTTQGLESFDGTTSKTYELPGSYENRYIWNIAGLPNGNKLVAMPDGTIMEFDGRNFTNFSQKYGLDKFYIYDLMIDSDHALWISSDQGVYKVSLDSDKITHYTEEDGLANHTVFNIFEDTSGRKWIATYYGLNVLEDGEWTTIRMKDGLIHNQINYITEDERGNIWVGTRGGISVIKEGKYANEAKIDNFGKEAGMTLMNTHFLWFDEQGYLWQGTNGGLQKLDVPSYRQTGKMSISHYSLSQQGLGLEFNFNALVTSKGKAWMGSMEGLVQLNPAKLHKEPLHKLQITNITANTLPIDWESHTDSLHYHNGRLDYPSVTFSPGKNIFEFSFKGISYTNPDNVLYRYKLEGFDNKWMPVTDDNSAVYTNLSPGNYTFVVEAKYKGDSFGARKASYDFAIAFPFWQTYWFYALVLVSCLGLIYGYVRFRVNKVEKQKLERLVDEQTKHLQKALEEKEVLIKEIHHRVKNNLAVISGLLELQMGQSDNDFASRVLSESQRRVQSISMIHEKLYQNERLSEINFEKYVRELIDIISYSFSSPDKEIEVDIKIDDFKLGVDQGIPCGLILNELVSNAFEHAFKGQQQGQIKIQITESSDNIITLIVADDGCGIDEEFVSAETDSLGFTLVQTLCKQLETELKVEDNNPGTRFIVEFQREEAQPKVPA